MPDSATCIVRAGGDSVKTLLAELSGTPEPPNRAHGYALATLRQTFPPPCGVQKYRKVQEPHTCPAVLIVWYNVLGPASQRTSVVLFVGMTFGVADRSRLAWLCLDEVTQRASSACSTGGGARR